MAEVPSAVLLFIVPLIAPQFCRDWSVTSALCSRTLRSIAQQSDKRFHALLVCDSPPDVLPTNPKLTIIQQQFNLPDPSRIGSRMWNKREKLKAGLIAARGFDADFVMFVDSDDC